jgi:hypothetical protein
VKNSKNPYSHFSAKIGCIGKVGPNRAERTAGGANIAKALIWPTPLLKISYWRSMAKFFAVFHRK